MTTPENVVATTEIELLMPSKDLADKLYNSLALLVGDTEITSTNVVLIATNLMQTVEKYPKLSGEQKKNLLLHVLKKYVKDKLDGSDEDNVLMFIDMFLPSVIDTIIQVDKKALVVSIKTGLKALFSCC